MRDFQFTQMKMLLALECKTRHVIPPCEQGLMVKFFVLWSLYVILICFYCCVPLSESVKLQNIQKYIFLIKTSYTSVCSKTFLNLTNNAERGNKYFEETEWRNASKQEKVWIMSVNSFLVMIVNYCSLLDFFEKQRGKFEEITSAKVYKTVGLLFCLHAKTTHVDYLNWVILNHAARALYGSW